MSATGTDSAVDVGSAWYEQCRAALVREYIADWEARTALGWSAFGFVFVIVCLGALGWILLAPPHLSFVSYAVRACAGVVGGGVLVYEVVIRPWEKARRSAYEAAQLWADRHMRTRRPSP